MNDTDLSPKNRFNKFTLVLIAAVIVVLGGGFFVFQKILNNNSQAVSPSGVEQDLSFDPEGPYAIIYPRRDGNALELNLMRTASYDSISYELAYTSKAEAVEEGGKDVVNNSGEMVDRGVMGTINTKGKKGEYEQEILLGTCSKNDCKYDQGVENGTLTLHIKKGNEAYRMVTQWHLQQPDIALGKLTSADGHFAYTIDGNSTDLSLIGYTIINDLTGAPKLPEDKAVVGKVYSVNSPVAKDLPTGQISIELADNPTSDEKIAWYDEANNKWVELDTKIDGSSLMATATSGGTFTVFAPKKS